MSRYTPGVVERLHSTRAGPVPPFVGVDMSDLTVARPRPADVCGLTRRRSGVYEAEFWCWARPGPEGGRPFIEDLHGARSVAIDAPQALAAPRFTRRLCEKLISTPARTPCDRALVTGPYAGFVLTSLDLFATIAAAGFHVGSASVAPAIWEVFPANLWRVLSGALAPKASAAGKRQRRAILEALGVVLPPVELSHDQLDAAVAAVAAATPFHGVAGLRAQLAARSRKPMRRRRSCSRG